MKAEKTILFIIVFCVLLLGFSSHAPGNHSSKEVYPGPYAELLSKYVKNGVVDYGGLKRDEAKLDQYLHLLEQTDTTVLSRNEQFAFYVNAYNAWTIKLILSGYPGVKSIKDLGGYSAVHGKRKSAVLTVKS